MIIPVYAWYSSINIYSAFFYFLKCANLEVKLYKWLSECSLGSLEVYLRFIHGVNKIKIIFIIYYKILLLFHFHFIKNGAFQRLHNVWYCSKINAETDLRIQLSFLSQILKRLHEHKTMLFLSLIVVFGKILFFKLKHIIYGNMS